MKPSHILTACLLLFCQILPAQSSFKLDPETTTYIDKAQIECIYRHTINAPLNKYFKEKEGDRKEQIIYKTVLQTNSIVSKYWDWNSFKKDSIIACSTKKLTVNELDSLTEKYYINAETLYLPVILKNYPKNKITVTDEIVASDYIYTQDKANLNWELLDDTLSVCGYTCNKAKCSYGGREWTAWYTPEISISDGPWKLFGLPGLILKAQDSTLTHIFEATTIRKSELPIFLTKSSLRIKTSRNEFVKNKNKFEADRQGLLMQLLVKCKPVGDNMLLNGKRSCWRRTTDYCPLELK